MAYSEDQISDALAVLVSNGGNIARTRRELDAADGWERVPARSTLTKWREREARPATARDEAVSENAHQKKDDLAALYERLTRQCLGAAFERVEEASFKDLMRAAGIATDKMQLLRKEATSIEEQRGGAQANVFQQIDEALILDGPAEGESFENGHELSSSPEHSPTEARR